MFDKKQNEVNQLHDLMLIFGNYADLNTDQIKSCSRNDALKPYDAYQYISSISGCMTNLIDDIYKDTHKMDQEYLNNMQDTKSLKLVSK
ncbi:hypothetical protein R5R59_01045 [Oenococcus oeni]